MKAKFRTPAKIRRITIYHNGVLVYQAAGLMKRPSGRMASATPSPVGLVRFTWANEQVLQKLNELSNQLSTTKF